MFIAGVTDNILGSLTGNDWKRGEKKVIRIVVTKEGLINTISQCRHKNIRMEKNERV